MILSVLAVEAVLEASMDLLVLDSCVDSIRSSVVVGHSTSPSPMFLLCGWQVGAEGC